MVKLNIFLITGTNKIISNKTKDDNNAKNKYLLCPFPFVKIESVLDLWLNACSICEIAKTEKAIVCPTI